MQVAIFVRRTQRTTMASHGTSPSSQSPAMLPAGRHEPFVQRKARRRPYRRCPWGSFDVWWCLATPEFSVFFFGGGLNNYLCQGFFDDPGKGGERDLWWNSGVPVSFCFFFWRDVNVASVFSLTSLVHFGGVSLSKMKSTSSIQ